MHVVATAGHVDHGKSTLLRALTAMEPDRWEEERRRGLTIDLGFVWTGLDVPGDDARLTVAFVDVPGHERFIANMLAGAGAVQLALFVVAADDGWSAQSQEHLDILDLLGVRAAVVAVTKADLAGDERAAAVAADVSRRLAATSLAEAPVLVVDGVSGRGLDELRATLARRLAQTPAAGDIGRPRLWIDRSFTITGAGTVTTGTLVGGWLRVGQELIASADGRTVRVRGLQSLGADIDAAAPGSRVAVNLSGIDRDEVGRGDALVGLTAGDGRPAPARAVRGAWRATAMLDAWVRALPGHEIGRTGSWHLHAGSAEVIATVHPLLHDPAVDGRPAHIRIELARPLPLTAGDRFVLREAGRQATLGGGTVLDPDPPPTVRGPDARLARAADLDAVRDALEDGRHPLVPLLAAAGGARPTDRAAAAAGLAPGRPLPDGAVAVAGHLASNQALSAWAGAVLAAAGARHAADPGGRGAGRDQLAAAASEAGCPDSLAAGLVDALAQRGALHRDGSYYTLPEHAAVRDEAREERRRALLHQLTAEPFSPPPLEEAARHAGVDHQEVNALVTRGEVVVTGGVAFARSAIDLAVQRLAELGERFTTAEAREALGTTRKYAVPLLEHLDGVGITEFDGQTRRLRV